LKKFKSKAGYTVYEATAKDTEKLGGCGICDSCSSYSEKGYLIPVMNHYHCPECFKEWDKRANYYPEDLAIEEKNEAYYDSVFGFDIETIKSKEELGEELCDYCPLPEELKGVHNYGGLPTMCCDNGPCDEAYENYLEELKED